MAEDEQLHTLQSVAILRGGKAILACANATSAVRYAVRKNAVCQIGNRVFFVAAKEGNGTGARFSKIGTMRSVDKDWEAKFAALFLTKAASIGEGNNPFLDTSLMAVWMAFDPMFANLKQMFNIGIVQGRTPVKVVLDHHTPVYIDTEDEKLFFKAHEKAAQEGAGAGAGAVDEEPKQPVEPLTVDEIDLALVKRMLGDIHQRAAELQKASAANMQSKRKALDNLAKDRAVLDTKRVKLEAQKKKLVAEEIELATKETELAAQYKLAQDEEKTASTKLKHAAGLRACF